MKNVLVLTDFSEAAEVASEVGIRIAKKMNTGITFLHLISTPVEWRTLPLEKENLYPETKAAIGDAKDKLFRLEKKAENLSVEAHTSLVYNLGIEDVYTYIRKDNYDLVVIGAQGKKGSKKSIGSNTVKVINKSSVPVLTIKPGVNPEIPKNWLVVSNFREQYYECFAHLIKIAKKLEAAVQLLYVNTPYFFSETHEIEQKMEKFTTQYPDMNMKAVIIDAFNEEQGLVRYVKSSDHDLVSVIIHGGNGLSAYHRSIAEKILNQVDLPFLSTNADK